MVDGCVRKAPIAALASSLLAAEYLTIRLARRSSPPCTRNFQTQPGEYYDLPLPAVLVDRRRDRGGLRVVPAGADPGRDHAGVLLPLPGRAGDLHRARLVDGAQHAVLG